MMTRLRRFLVRLRRAWAYYHRLGFAWRAAWAKAGSDVVLE